MNCLIVMSEVIFAVNCKGQGRGDERGRFLSRSFWGSLPTRADSSFVHAVSQPAFSLCRCLIILDWLTLRPPILVNQTRDSRNACCELRSWSGRGKVRLASQRYDLVLIYNFFGQKHFFDTNMLYDSSLRTPRLKLRSEKSELATLAPITHSGVFSIVRGILNS